MTIHYLVEWGCPPGLIEGLNGALESTSSRRLLLALGWLVARSCIFEEAVRELQPQASHMALLPPYPMVRYVCHTSLCNCTLRR